MGIATTTSLYGGGDYTWLASQRGTEHPKSGTLDVSAFAITGGYIPSGTPVKINAGKLVPADAVATKATLAGFVAHDIAASTTGPDQPCAYHPDATIVAAKTPGVHDLTDGRYICDQQDDAV